MRTLLCDRIADVCRTHIIVIAVCIARATVGNGVVLTPIGWIARICCADISIHATEICMCTLIREQIAAIRCTHIIVITVRTARATVGNGNM